MDMKKFIDTVRSADEDSILEMLFECYNAQNGLDNDKIRQEFEILYEAMNGKTLREKDEVIYAISEIAVTLKRNSRAVRKRLQKLGVVE